MKPASFDRLERTFEKQIKTTNIGRSQLGTLSSIEIPTLLMSDSDLQVLEHAMDSLYSNGQPRYQYAAAYVLIANTGLRFGEALALTWNNVDFVNKTVIVVRIHPGLKKETTKPFQEKKGTTFL